MSNKDVLFFSIIGIYFISSMMNLFVYTFIKAEYIVAIFIATLWSLAFIKMFSCKFSSWLEKPFRNRK